MLKLHVLWLLFVELLTKSCVYSDIYFCSAVGKIDWQREVGCELSKVRITEM
jgi:hypothetical protein